MNMFQLGHMLYHYNPLYHNLFFQGVGRELLTPNIHPGAFMFQQEVAVACCSDLHQEVEEMKERL